MNTRAEVVQDILKNLDDTDKDNIRNTPEQDLILFHHGWGTSIRNRYKIWQNKALLADIGKEHPDDASMVIIRDVWKLLQEESP